jgi:glyceraldehyde-3-phosphate dehydrogenase type II
MSKASPGPIVHVVGTGTIGEPLIGLLTNLKDELGIGEVTFHKNTPRRVDRPKLAQLVARGAKLAADRSRFEGFTEIGSPPSFEAEEAMRRADVIIDCTPEGVGRKNKVQYYEKFMDDTRGFIAQGSEFGFGKMYARGINDHVLEPGKDKFIQVVSCNTHNISVLLKTLGDDGKGGLDIEKANFVCLRRANDISQDGGYVPSPQVGKHNEAEFGTHHARDAHLLFKTMGHELDLFSSAVKLNTQYMHALQFHIHLTRDTTLDEVLARFEENPRVALTEKVSANQVFSFGREQGFYGRILNTAVVSVPTLTVRRKREVAGFCFTPQDGNSLLSSVAATIWFLDPDSVDARMKTLRRYMFREV